MNGTTLRAAVAGAVMWLPPVAEAGIGDFFGSVVDSVGNGVSAVGRAVGLSDLTSGLDGTLIDYLAEREAKAGPKGEGEEGQSIVRGDEGFAMDRLQMRQAGSSLGSFPKVERYVNGVLEKLLDGWPGEKPDVRVYVTSNAEFRGDTLKHGAIFIPLGTLVQLENEDQLAALLGHEISHILLHHHDKDVVDELKDKAFGYGELVLRMTEDDQSDMRRNYLKMKLAEWAASYGLLPKWSRGQETEADVLGTDLMLRAGYNRNGVSGLLKRVEAAAKQRHDEAASVGRGGGAGGEAGRVTLSLESIVDSIGASLADEFGDEHEDAKERRKVVREYLRKNYPPGNDPDLRVADFKKVVSRGDVRTFAKVYDAEQLISESSDEGGGALKKAAVLVKQTLRSGFRDDPYPWKVLYDIRIAQDDVPSAVENLGLGIRSDGAPFIMYRKLVLHAIEAGDFMGALTHLDRVRRDFGNDDDLLDLRVQALKRLGRPTGDAVLRCLALGRPKLAQRCQQAKEGKQVVRGGGGLDLGNLLPKAAPQGRGIAENWGGGGGNPFSSFD